MIIQEQITTTKIQPKIAFTHGIDVSHYDEKIDWPLLKQGGVEFAIVKVSQGDYRKDPACPDHLEKAALAGLTTAIYHWCDPICGDDSQLNYLLETLAGLAYQFVCLDVEQTWASWSAWPAPGVPPGIGGRPRKPKKKGKTKQAPDLLSPERISQNAHHLALGLRARLPQGVPVVIYTRTSFILEYARPMLAWLPQFPIWLAQYPLLRGTASTLDWSDLNQVLSTSFRPTLPPGCPAWTIWQWSGDRFRLPGISSHPDLNVFAGSNEDFRKFIHPAPVQGGEDVCHRPGL
jgi:GH25 family lysozyme M1 (1,4-beta-N-acetylmuramidase)